MAIAWLLWPIRRSQCGRYLYSKLSLRSLSLTWGQPHVPVEGVCYLFGCYVFSLTPPCSCQQSKQSLVRMLKLYHPVTVFFFSVQLDNSRLSQHLKPLWMLHCFFLFIVSRFLICLSSAGSSAPFRVWLTWLKLCIWCEFMMNSFFTQVLLLNHNKIQTIYCVT